MTELSLLSSDDLVSTETLPDVITNAPLEIQQNIHKLCLSIDEEQHKIRSAAIEIGKALYIIRETIIDQCRLAKTNAKENGISSTGITAKPIFEAFINARFRKGVDWANRLILIFRRFKEDDPLLEICTTYSLIAITRLEDKQIDTSSIRERLLSGERLTIDEINKIESSFTNLSENLNVVQETSDQLIQLQTKVERTEKEIERNEREKNQLKNEVAAKAEQNENLIQQLREKQEFERNISMENQRNVDALKSQLKAMEEDLRKAKSATTPVEIPTIPKGFSSIEEAILHKQEELSRLTEEIAKSNETFINKAAATKLFGELHEHCSTISIKALETINKTTQSDIEENRQVIVKIMHMLNSTHNALLQVA